MNQQTLFSMGLTENRIGNYEDSHDEKTRAEKVLERAKATFKKRKLKMFRLDSKTVVFMPSKKAFEEFKKAYHSKDRIIWE